MSLAADFSVLDSASAHDLMRLGPQSLAISLNMFKHVGAKPTFTHTQITHPNNPIYLSSEDEWKHCLCGAILTLGFQDLGF